MGANTLGQSSADRYRAPALDKGLDILELLSQQPAGLTRGEIVKAMGRGPSEVYRMLERLVARGYVGRSIEGDRYALTMKLFALAHRHPPLRRLIAPALPLMDGFAKTARQSCHLVAPDGDDAIVVARASGPGGWDFGLRVGAVIDFLRTGSGQLLLAFMAPDEKDRLLRKWEGASRGEAFERLSTALAAYRAAGYRVGKSGEVHGVEDISVPILSPEGFALAVLTCPFVHRVDDAGSSIDEALALLRRISGDLSLS